MDGRNNPQLDWQKQKKMKFSFSDHDSRHSGAHKPGAPDESHSILYKPIYPLAGKRINRILKNVIIALLINSDMFGREKRRNNIDQAGRILSF